MGAFDQGVEIVERSEHWIDRAKVGDIIAEVAHRRGEEGRQPDGVDAEARDIVELGGDPRKVPHSVAVGVREAARIDLIDCRSPPPGLASPD